MYVMCSHDQRVLLLDYKLHLYIFIRGVPLWLHYGSQEHGWGGNDSRYQTGALTPLLRWFSQSAQRAMMPPQQPNPVLPEGNLEGGESLVTIHKICKNRNIKLAS